MKLEHIAAGSQDCPLIRLSAFECRELAQLAASIELLKTGRVMQIALHEAPYVQTIGDCHLFLRSAAEGRGVVATPAGHFDWILTPDGCDDVLGLMEPFLQGSGKGSFQWLDERGEVRVLLSTGGTW